VPLTPFQGENIRAFPSQSTRYLGPTPAEPLQWLFSPVAASVGQTEDASTAVMSPTGCNITIINATKPIQDCLLETKLLRLRGAERLLVGLLDPRELIIMELPELGPLSLRQAPTILVEKL